MKDTATGMLVGDFECGSEITGIQFNAQLKQVASSHHSSLEEGTDSHAVIREKLSLTKTG